MSSLLASINGLRLGSDQDALDVLSSGLPGCEFEIADLHPEFFDFSNGIAGARLQKFSNYQYRVGIDFFNPLTRRRFGCRIDEGWHSMIGPIKTVGIYLEDPVAALSFYVDTMGTSGQLSHIDISVGYPERSIPFYDALLSGLGYKRMETNHPGFERPNPRRAWWSLEYADGSRFGIEVRPAYEEKRDRKYDRYEPGPHHIAFHAADRDMVDRIHHAMVEIGAQILDAPLDYSGQSGYSQGYYAVFIADPDGVKLEVVHRP